MRTLRNILFATALALLAADGFCGVGATEKWVANYVSNYVAGVAAPVVTTSYSNGVRIVEGRGFRIEVEDKTEKAIGIVEQTQLSAIHRYTNGLILARAPGRDAYVAGRREIGFGDTQFHCTAGGKFYHSEAVSNRTWLVRSEVVTNMTEVAISGPIHVSTNRVLFCAIARAYITPSMAAAILEE